VAVNNRSDLFHAARVGLGMFGVGDRGGGASGSPPSFWRRMSMPSRWVVCWRTSTGGWTQRIMSSSLGSLTLRLRWWSRTPECRLVRPPTVGCPGGGSWRRTGSG